MKCLRWTCAILSVAMIWACDFKRRRRDRFLLDDSNVGVTTVLHKPFPNHYKRGSLARIPAYDFRRQYNRIEKARGNNQSFKPHLAIKFKGSWKGPKNNRPNYLVLEMPGDVQKSRTKVGGKFYMTYTGIKDADAQIEDSLYALCDNNWCHMYAEKTNCYSSETTYIDKNGDAQKMIDLKVGDEVLTTSGYQKVWVFGRRHTETSVNFVQVYTASGNGKGKDRVPLELTEDHLVFLYGDKENPVAARDLKVGDYVIGYDHATKKPIKDRVTKIRSVKRDGLYGPFTTDGTMVVGGVLTSTYITPHPNAPHGVLTDGTELPWLNFHRTMHLFMSPFRLWCLGVSGAYCETRPSNFEPESGKWYPNYVIEQLYQVGVKLPAPIQMAITVISYAVLSVFYAIETIVFFNFVRHETTYLMSFSMLFFFIVAGAYAASYWRCSTTAASPANDEHGLTKKKRKESVVEEQQEKAKVA